MRYINLFASFLLLCVTCTSESEFKIPDSGSVLTDVLTHVLTIGGEKEIQEEFILVNPMSYCIAVNDENDIFVFDEASIKVYDENGKPKKIIGGPGEGPGEFYRSSSYSLWIGPTGYMTAFGGQHRDELNLFTPDYKFLEQINYRQYKPYEHIFTELNISAGIPLISQPSVALNETDRILLIEGDGIKDKFDREYYSVLIYKSGNMYKKIAHYKQSNRIISIYSTSGTKELGSLMAAILTNNRLVYTQTYHETYIGEKEAKYNLFIISLDDFSKSTITRNYIPVKFTEKEFPLISKEEKDKALIELYEKTIDVYKERKYKSPLQNILTDRNFIFAFTYEKNESEEIFTDIFNADTEKYLSSAYFPFIPSVIKNGYAYHLKRVTATEFAEIKKYKIDPAVYGK